MNSLNITSVYLNGRVPKHLSTRTFLPKYLMLQVLPPPDQSVSVIIVSLKSYITYANAYELQVNLTHSSHI